MNLPSTQVLQTPQAPPNTLRTLATLLGGMMFLEWTIRGIWLPYLSDYLNASIAAGGLGFTGGQVGWILGFSSAMGALTAPLIAGQLADRTLNAERTLALLMLIGGVLIFLLAPIRAFMPFLLVLTAYSITAIPTISLTNSICMQSFPGHNAYPRFRLLGMLGWTTAASLFPLLWLNSSNPAVNTARVADALRIAGVLSLCLGLYSLHLLPGTPRKNGRRRSWALYDAMKLLRHRAFLVLLLTSLPLAVVNQALYFRIAPFLRQDLGVPLAWVGMVTTMGTWTEMALLFFLGYFLRRLGFKRVMLLGLVCYTARYIIFAVGQPLWLVIAAQSLHGIGEACWFGTMYLCIDAVAPTDVRHSAQMLFAIATFGAGPLLAAIYNQYFDRFHTVTRTAAGIVSTQSYTQFWTAQAMIVAAAALLLLAFFPRMVQRAS